MRPGLLGTALSVAVPTAQLIFESESVPLGPGGLELVTIFSQPPVCYNIVWYKNLQMMPEKENRPEHRISAEQLC